MGNHSGTHLIGGLIEGFNESKRESQCGRTVVFEQTLADLLTYLFYCQLRPWHVTIVGGGWNGNESAQITRGSLHNARSITLFGWQNELAVTCLEFGNYPVVGEAGLEPAHPFGHRNLNPARLPIPPLARATGRGYPKIQTPVIKGLLGPRPTKCSNAPLNPPSGTLCRPWRATNGPERESLETISLPVPPTRG